MVSAGLQTTIQAAPFSGFRHIGMPSAGAADCLSFILANRLVEKGAEDAALEITLGDAKFLINSSCTIAVTGAARFLHVNGTSVPLHRATIVQSGDEIHIGPAKSGCRSYLSINRSLPSDIIMDGCSTYLAAGLGGYVGRALRNGDILNLSGEYKQVPSAETPTGLVPSNSENFLLRVTTGPEFSNLPETSQQELFSVNHIVGRRSNRMGLALTGCSLEVAQAGLMNSAPVFPGTIQCPPDGAAFLLGPDAQTTGGYPRIAQVICADRHLIGQMRPGSKIQLVKISAQRATEIYREKLALLTPWIGTTGLW